MSNSKLNIWPQETRFEDGRAIISATLEFPDKSSDTLWYSVPEEFYTPSLNDDHFLVALIYKIMDSGLPVHVHGEISRSLVQNLDEYMEAWRQWLPDLSRVIISADRLTDIAVPASRDDAVVAFSGGVDSCFTAFRHARKAGPQIPYHPVAGIMVHGFDIPLEESAMFNAAIDRSREMLNSLNMYLIPVATNFRSLVSDWSHTFGAAVASCLMLFAPKFKNGLIGQGFTYKEIFLLHEGSNPITDALLSSHLFRIVPDGTSYTRAEKIGALHSWDEFLRYLRVCWQGPEKDKNCCECEKCTRNILTFKALGMDLPPCFSKDVTVRLLKTFKMGMGSLPEIRYGRLPAIARANEVQGEWIEIIEERIKEMRLQKTRNFVYGFSKFMYYQLRLWEKVTGKPMNENLDSKRSEGVK